MKQRYCDVKNMSEYTSLPEKTLYEWASMGRIPSIKIGRRILFDINDIDEVLSKLKRVPGRAEKVVNKIIGDIRDDGI